ncbi:ArsR/SmtB family transcription factor [Streptomyces acidicola]|uniref:Helix-turn-helix transcriptional regulator n=1 Tax=Streptomyces acidicola TaxID=2596892 RepID=A0A5N8WMA2_9ACTN|nr:metalloregulator ArsR/SmtB family transcription factor [Streptomyces acidicola]MPY48377.1 helix-turn-helix transcriptional regulator [Streptomyces acidicola]
MPNLPAPDAAPEPLPGRHSEPTGAQLAAAAETFALLASPPRLHLVWLITHGAYDVGTLATRVGLSIATASQHLSKLRLAGVITARREGRRHIYTVEDPHVLTLIAQIFDHIAPDGTLAPDPPL